MLVLQPFVLSFLSAEALCAVLAFVASVATAKIALKYDPHVASKEQYALAHRVYLISAIAKFILYVKIPLFLFFIWTLDEAAKLVPGAMCAAGVVSGSEFGEAMFGVKILNLFLLSGWLYLNVLDFRTPTCAYAKLKFRAFCVVFVLILAELFLEISHFLSVSTDEPVQCCGEIFKENVLSNFAFYHNEIFISALFYAVFVLCAVMAWRKKAVLFGVSEILFLFVAIYAIIRVFSPYIYELPIHKCPFCMLDAEYYFVGYLIYILLYFGAIGGVFALVSRVVGESFSSFWYKFSLAINALTVLLLSAYVAHYVLKNGVWL